MTPFQVKKTADEFCISYLSAAKMRMRYLVDTVEAWGKYISEETGELPPLTTIDAINEIIALREYEKRLQKGIKGAITDEMIESARNHPIERIIEFVKGSAIAWCHNDTRPSLMWDRARNRATCFPCGKSFNTIDVLMERDGKTFTQAVKELA